MIWKRHFEAGPPRKLARLAREIDLEKLRVLELGCGYGTYLVHFPRASVGLDLSPQRVEFARSLDLNAEVRDVEAPGWTRGLAGFDLVWICDLLPHLEHPARLLASLPALLAPGGRIAISEWIWPESAVLSTALSFVLPDGRATLRAPEHRRRVTRRTLASWLDAAGMQVEREWLHSVDSPALAALLRPLLPPRTMLAAPRSAVSAERPSTTDGDPTSNPSEPPHELSCRDLRPVRDPRRARQHASARIEFERRLGGAAGLGTAS